MAPATEPVGYTTDISPLMGRITTGFFIVVYVHPKPLAFHIALPIAIVVSKGLSSILSVRFVICTFIMSFGILAVTVTHFAIITPFPLPFTL